MSDMNVAGVGGYENAQVKMPTWEMSNKEKLLTKLEADRINKETFGNRLPKKELDREDFLKLIIEQLKHQDPTEPVKDTEFIGQMAQFSTLQQMNTVSDNFIKLNETLSTSEAVNAVGKRVTVESGSGTMSGVITASRRGEIPEVLINGSWHAWSTVKTVYAENAN